MLTFRWLKHSGVYLGSEKKQRALSRELIGDNLEVELVPFTFTLAGGREEIRGAAHAYIHAASLIRSFNS